jgi:hypothetical protein
LGRKTSIICMVANLSSTLRGVRPGASTFSCWPRGDVQAVGEEGDKDVRFDAPLVLMKDRPDGEVTFERSEGGLDFDQLQIELPELGRISLGEIGAQQVAAFA